MLKSITSSNNEKNFELCNKFNLVPILHIKETKYINLSLYNLEKERRILLYNFITIRNKLRYVSRFDHFMKCNKICFDIKNNIISFIIKIC